MVDALRQIAGMQRVLMLASSARTIEPTSMRWPSVERASSSVRKTKGRRLALLFADDDDNAAFARLIDGMPETSLADRKQ
jgi:hypothetical protein